MRFSPAVLLPALALAAPADFEIEQRANCAPIHVFGARETTASAGYGTSANIVNGILSAHSGATAEAIVYPACGGQSSCGGVAYADSASQGQAAVAKAVNAYAASCPDAKLVLAGYSQGGQIIDWAYCGNPSTGFTAAALKQIKAVIYMGTPTNTAGLSYNVGTCTNHGFAARASGYSCTQNKAIIKSYCDAADPYCCNGNDANTHQQYANKYGSEILSFVNGLLA